MTEARVLVELVVVLGTATVVTAAFQALRLPVVLGYVLAGIVIGPHVPVPLVADAGLIHVLSELGVILLMFTIGLELPLATIARVGAPAALTALFEVALVVAAGTLVAQLLGFATTQAVFLGGCLGISSTMLVAKAFDEMGWKGGFTEVVFAVLVFEDLIAVVLLAVVTAVATGAGLDAAALVTMLAKLGGFLALVLIGGLAYVPRAIRWLASRARRETLLIGALLLCFGMSLLAQSAGYSVALGAFIAGVLIAESGRGHAVFSMVESFRDVFAMMFFVSVGLSIDPRLLVAQAVPILVFSAVVLVFKPLGVGCGVFLGGKGVRPAVRAGLSLAQIGEFSFVIAGVAADASLLAIAVGVSCVTTLMSPLLIRRSEAASVWVTTRMPARLATFVSFYESWLERFRAREESPWQRYRRKIAVVAFDAAMIIAIAIAGGTVGTRLLARSGLAPGLSEALRLAAIALASTPFAVSIIRSVAWLARQLAAEMIPAGGPVDLGRAARRAVVLTLQLALALVIAVPVIAATQPFVPSSAILLLVIAVVAMIGVRRSLHDFEGHVHASSALMLELLSRPDAEVPLAQVATILPGFAGTSTCIIPERASSVGRSLAELGIRAKTGATVLAIVREGANLAMPSPSEPLRAGDTLAVAGSAEAIAAARQLLQHREEP
jgi:CPA2 family monovalent cation:H+ antiporter-2